MNNPSMLSNEVPKPGGAVYACSCLSWAFLMLPIGIMLSCLFTGGLAASGQDSLSVFSTMPFLMILVPGLSIILGLLVLPPKRIQKLIRWFARW
jgi:hypothetical protein